MERDYAFAAGQRLPASRTDTAPAHPVWEPEMIMDSGGQAINLRDLLTVVFKHRRKILSALLAAILLAGAAYFLYFRYLPVIYEAEARLMIRYGNEYMDNNPGLGETPLPYGQEEIMASEISILGSRDLREKVVTNLGPQSIYPDLSGSSKSLVEQALKRMEKDLSIETIERSPIILISFFGKHPETAAGVVNSLVDLYKEERVRVISDPMSTQFLEQKVEDYYNNLRASQEKFESFKRETGVYSFEDHMNTLVQQQMNWENVLISDQTQLKQLQSKLSFLSEMVQKTAGSSAGSELVNETRAKLLALQLKERELATKYTDKNQLLISTRSEIELLKDFMRKNGAASGPLENSGFNLHTQLRMDSIRTQEEIRALEIHMAETRQQLVELGKKISSLNLLGNRFQDLQREVELNAEYYQTYLNKLEEARISDDMRRRKMTSVGVVQAAAIPAFPVQIPRGIIFFLAAGAGIGLVGGIGLAFLLELIGQRISVPGDAERRLRLPVLATIPYKG